MIVRVAKVGDLQPGDKLEKVSLSTDTILTQPLCTYIKLYRFNSIGMLRYEAAGG